MPSIIELGQKVKAKYPEYADMSDLEVGQKVKARYPNEYSDFTDVSDVDIQRQERVAAGLPVSVNKNKAEPTLGGQILRGIIKAPLKTALTVAAPLAGTKGLTVKSKYLGDTSDIAKTVKDKADELANRVNKGEISLKRAITGVLGESLLNVADVASIAPVGGTATSLVKNTGQALAKEGLKAGAKQLAKEGAKSFARGAGYGTVYDVGAQASSGEKYNPAQTVKSALLAGALDVGLSKGVPALAGTVKSAAKKQFTKEGRIANIIAKREKELAKLDGAYASLRKASGYSKDAGVSSRKRVAQTDVLANSVDTDGTIRTKQPGGAVDQYKAQTIEGAEATVRQNLERLGEKVNLSKVESQLLKAVRESGLEGADLKNALNNVKKEISGYKLKADKDGNVPLTLVHDAKISTTRNINYQTPPEIKASRKAIARGLKETIENNSKFNVKEVNNELSKYYEDIKLLERLDGKKVKGGKLGKYFSQISGNIIGGVAGSAVGGPVGSAIGTIVGGELAGRIKGSFLSKTLGKATGTTAQKSKILQKASDLGKSGRLMLPAPKPGAPRSQIGSGKTINLPAKLQTEKSTKRVSDTIKKYLALPKPSGKPIGTPYSPGVIRLPAKSQSAIDADYSKSLGNRKAIYNKTNTANKTGIPPIIPGIPKELQPLAKEARKYKSAEEFVKAQPSYFRGEGGSDVAQGKALLAEGRHFAMDAEYPKRFGEVKEYVAKPNAKVFDARGLDFPQIREKLGLGKSSYISPKELTKTLKEQGYDIFRYDGTYQSTGKTFEHIVEITPDSLVTKSQLTDIWNKANKNKGSATIGTILGVGGATAGLSAGALAVKRMLEKRANEKKKPVETTEAPKFDRKTFEDKIVNIENEALKASGGNLYESIGVSGDLGKYQANPQTVIDWSDEWLGRPYTPKEFLNDPQAQEKFWNNFLDVVERLNLTPEEAAVTWHRGWGKLGTGEPRPIRDRNFREWLAQEMKSPEAKKYLAKFNR